MDSAAATACKCSCNCAKDGAGNCAAATAPQVRWSALATGSLLGIAAWAFLYVLGAVLSWPLLTMEGGASAGMKAVVGLYGALAASAALLVGSWSAAKVGRAGNTTQATLYGACLWSMASITLVITVLLASHGWLSFLSSEASAIAQVGLSAVGMQNQAEGTASPMLTLCGMLATMALSFPFAITGARRAL